jgi:hypothetical protein
MKSPIGGNFGPATFMCSSSEAESGLMCRTFIRVPPVIEVHVVGQQRGSFACTNRARSFMAALSSSSRPGRTLGCIDVHDGLRHVSSRALCAHPHHLTRLRGRTSAASSYDSALRPHGRSLFHQVLGRYELPVAGSMVIGTTQGFPRRRPTTNCWSPGVVAPRIAQQHPNG